jgi:MOSC domain-containing protein
LTWTEIGHLEAIFRYPVKSMAGERLQAVDLGWHGVARLAFRRLEDRGGFPWLSAGKLAELLLFVPVRGGSGGEEELPTLVRTPEGREMDVFGDELAAEIGRRHGAPVQMMRLKQGVFDEACVSVITPGHRPRDWTDRRT